MPNGLPEARKNALAIGSWSVPNGSHAPVALVLYSSAIRVPSADHWRLRV